MWKKFKDFLLLLNPQEQSQLATTQSRRVRALASVKALQECLDSNKFSYQKASTITCDCCQTNMIHLYSHIENINNVLREKKALSPLDYTCNNVSLSVSELMVNDGMYIPTDIVGLFCLEASELCILLEEADDESSGVMAHNLRVLAMQLGTIREVSNAMIACYELKG